MGKRAFKKIMQGIKEARAYLEGTADNDFYRTHSSAKTGINRRFNRTSGQGKVRVKENGK